MEPQAQSTPDGASWAALLAAAIGCAAIGVLTDLAESSKSIGAALTFSKPVGNLSGKTTLGIVCWLIAWGLLHFRWKQRTLTTPGRVVVLSVILLIFAMVAVFPPFFGLFSAD